MPYTTKITNAEKILIPIENRDAIDVSFDILNDEGEVAASRRENFPLDTSPEDIEAAIAKIANAYEIDQQIALTSAELEADNAKADETIAILTGNGDSEDVAELEGGTINA